MIGIYCIENIINHKKYVGQTINTHQRRIGHRSSLNLGTHFNQHLQFAWNKYGENSFIFYVIEECKREELDERETYWIAKLDSTNRKYGYNVSHGGVFGNEEDAWRRMTSPFCGGHHSTSQRAKWSKSRKGTRLGEENSNCKISEQTAKEIISALANGEPNVAIARRLNIPKTIVMNIKYGLAWSHLTKDIDFHVKRIKKAS